MLHSCILKSPFQRDADRRHQVNNLLGRRGTIFFTNLFVIFPVLAQAFTQNWQGLLICRLFMGLGMGIKISTIPVYAAEVSPASIRGGMVTSFQLWVAFGIMFGFSSNLVFKDIGPLAWRVQLAAAFAPAVPLALLVWFCVESPRWWVSCIRPRPRRLQLTSDTG